jgi:transposase
MSPIDALAEIEREAFHTIPTLRARISKIGNAVLRAALYMPAMSAMQHNPAIVALVARLKSRGRLKPKQIVVAAMRKLLVLCFGVLKTGKPFDPAIAMGC